MGRPHVGQRRILTEEELDVIERRARNQAWGGTGMVTFDPATVVALVAMARTGRKLLLAHHKRTPEERSAASRAAIARRWAEPGARERQAEKTREQMRRKRARNSTEPDDRAPPHDTARRKSASDGT